MRDIKVICVARYENIVTELRKYNDNTEIMSHLHPHKYNNHSFGLSTF